jgi:hypothetical protein
MRTRVPGKPATFSKRSAGPPALVVPRPDFETRSVISAISRRGETSWRMRRSSPDLSRSWIQSLRSLLGRAVAPWWIRLNYSRSREQGAGSRELKAGSRRRVRGSDRTSGSFAGRACGKQCVPEMNHRSTGDSTIGWSGDSNPLTNVIKRIPLLAVG